MRSAFRIIAMSFLLLGLLSTQTEASIAFANAVVQKFPKTIRAGQLEGAVLESDGTTPMAGVLVSIAGSRLNYRQSVVTSTDGTFSFGWIPIGNYTVTATKSGIGTRTTNATVMTGQTTNLRIVW